MRNQFLGMGIDENTIGSIFSKYYAPEPQQGMSPQAMTPPEPARYSPETTRPLPPEEPRRPDPNPEPRYEEPRPDQRPERPEIRPVMPEIYPQDYAGSRTTGSTQTQEIGPRTSYRINDDGSRTEIGYDGQPISGYTQQQLDMHNATTGVTPSEYRYVFNGEGYDKLPNGPQTGYGPTRDIAEPKFPERERPPERPPEEPRYEEPQRPDPMDFRREQEAEEERRREQESRDRQREAEEYYFRMRNAQYEEPVAPQMPYYPEMPMPETYIEPEVNFPEDPGFAPTPTPIGIAKSLQGGDIGKVLQDLASRGQTSQGLSALIAKALANGSGSLEEQRRLMELLGSIRG
jgi:hypothetical protein